MRTIKLIDATRPGVVVGRHALWCPELGLKVPFVFGGRLTKYGRAEPGYPPEKSIPHELAILRALAACGLAPPIGEVVFIETVISEHPGAWHADPCGAWAYEMVDATTLPPGGFDVRRMRELPIAGSPGAWGDIEKPGNVVNGYLVDVRRSAWDMLTWTGGGLPELPRPEQDLEELRARVHRECQFPAGERDQAYQDFLLAQRLEHGQRRVLARAQAMGFTSRLQPGQSVLDIGCQAGGFLQHAANLGARRMVGVELEPRYVDCARDLARSCGQNISIRQLDAVKERETLLAWVRALFPRGVDHLLLLSMEKHLGEPEMFDLIDAIGARRTYIETNAVSERSPMKLWPEVQARGGRHVGDTTDRNLRRLYQIGAP
jgi:hypothetical protein